MAMAETPMMSLRSFGPESFRQYFPLLDWAIEWDEDELVAGTGWLIGRRLGTLCSADESFTLAGLRNFPGFILKDCGLVFDSGEWRQTSGAPDKCLSSTQGSGPSSCPPTQDSSPLISVVTSCRIRQGTFNDHSNPSNYKLVPLQNHGASSPMAWKANILSRRLDPAFVNLLRDHSTRRHELDTT